MQPVQPVMQNPKLLDHVRQVLRARHYSRRTEEAYIHWIRRFILFHRKRHPATMSGEEVNRFLMHLASERNVAASTQNQGSVRAFISLWTGFGSGTRLDRKRHSRQEADAPASGSDA